MISNNILEIYLEYGDCKIMKLNIIKILTINLSNVQINYIAITRLTIMVKKDVTGLRMTIEEKREKARREIMQASLELFYEKGYQKTTTRDIINKAGILNGSLYNRFKSKEEILLNIVTDYLERTLDESEEFLGEEINPLIAAVLPGAFEVFISSKDRKIADLIYEVHKLWATVEILTDMNIEWFSKYLEKYGIRFDNKDDARIKTLSFVGAIGNICGHYANGGESDQNKVLYYMLSYMGAILGIPVIDMDGMISRLNEILEKSNIRFREETGV